MAVSHLLAVGSQIVGSRYLVHQRPAVSQGDFKWLEREHEQLCGLKCWSTSKVLGTQIALGLNCKLERDENILLLKGLQLLRSLNYRGCVWVSMILCGTVPAPKALLGAGPACAAHVEMSPKGRFWFRREEGNDETPFPAAGTQGAETCTSPSVSPQMPVVVPSPAAIERGRSPSPIAPLSKSFFLLPFPMPPCAIAHAWPYSAFRPFPNGYFLRNRWVKLAPEALQLCVQYAIHRGGRSCEGTSKGIM